MLENKKMHNAELEQVSGGEGKQVPNPNLKCPKCGKSFPRSEWKLSIGTLGYCEECQKNYPEELPINDPTNPLYMSLHQSTQGEDK